MTTEQPQRVRLDFYALGRMDNMPKITLNKPNKGISDNANNLLERNNLSCNSANLESLRNNYKSLHGLNEMNKDSNNYLKPLTMYNNKEKYGIKSDMTNKEMYNLTRMKYFSKDKDAVSINSGMNVSKEEFLNKKSVGNGNNHFSRFPVITETGNFNNISNKDKVERIKDNNLYFDKNNNQMIRYPKGFWNSTKE